MKATIFSNDFNRIVNATKKFVERDVINKIYKYIRLEFHAETSSVTAVASDGYRLSAEHAVCECDEDFVAYINAGTKLPRGKYATIEIMDKDVIIRCGDSIFGCSPNDGEFFDWENVLPKGKPIFQVGVNGNYLLSALQAAKISAGNSFKNIVALEFHGELEPVILRTNQEDIKLVLPVRIKK